MKKVLVVVSLLIIIALAGAGGLGLYYSQNREIEVILQLNDNRTVEFLDEVKVSDFILEINGVIKDDYVIETNELGKKNVKFTYINNDGVKVKREFDINIVDTVAPVVWLGSSYSINVGTEIDLAEAIMCGDNYDSNPKCEIVGEYDSDTVGVYPITYRATDNSGNVTEVPFNLNVVEPSSGGNNNISTERTLFTDVVSKYKDDNTEIGIDISEWQDEPDFEKLKKAGVEFVILRVGGTKYSTGDYFLDKSFIYNIENANKVGIPVGIYFYSYADSKKKVLEDAEWIYEQIKDYDVQLPIAFDWENWGFYNEFNLSFYELTDMSNSFLKFFEDKGYDGVLYSSKSYLEEIWLKSNYPIWLAHYTKDIEKSSYSGDYVYWQLCDDGKVDGVDGAVDINVRFKK